MKKRHILLFMLPLLLCCPRLAEATQEAFSTYRFDTFLVTIPSDYAGKGICRSTYDIGSAPNAQARMDIYEVEWGSRDQDATFEDAKQRLLLVTHPNCDCAHPCDRPEDAQAAFHLPGVLTWSVKNNNLKQIQAFLRLRNGYVVFEMSGKQLRQGDLEKDKAFFIDAVKNIVAQSEEPLRPGDSIAHTLFLRLDTSRGVVATLSMRFENDNGTFAFSSDLPPNPLQAISPPLLPPNIKQAWIVDKPLAVAGQDGHYHVRSVSQVDPQTKAETVISTTLRWERLDASKRKIVIAFGTSDPAALKQGYEKFLEKEQILRVLQSVERLP